MGAETEVASGYGEADIEAKAMSKAAAGPKSQVPEPSQIPAAGGTTESNIAADTDDIAVRSKKN